MAGGGGGGGFSRIGKCRTYLSVAPAIRPQQGTGVPNSSIDWLRLAGCSTPEVADSGRWESSLMAVASGDSREGDD